MPNPKPTEEPLVFRGTPRRLLLQGALPQVDEFEFEPERKLSTFLGSVRRPFKRKTNRQGDLLGLKVKLDPATPPGQYNAALKTKSGTIPVEIHVEARPRISAYPAQFAFTGAAGKKAKIHVTFINRGNVPCEIPQSDSVGVYDDDGIETAFASTYRQDSDKLETLLSHFIGKLRQGHGGLLKLRVLEGHGALPPAGRVAAVIEAQFSSGLKAGHSYHGVWSTSFADYAITVSVTK